MDEHNIEPSSSKKGKSGVKPPKGTQKSPRLMKGGVVARIKSNGAAVTFDEDGKFGQYGGRRNGFRIYEWWEWFMLHDHDKQKRKESKSGRDAREAKAAKGNGWKKLQR